MLYGVSGQDFFSPFVKEKTARESVYIALEDQDRWTKGDSWVFVFPAEGKNARNWKEVLKVFQGSGVERLGRSNQEDFPQADWKLCFPCIGWESKDYTLLALL